LNLIPYGVDLPMKCVNYVRTTECFLAIVIAVAFFTSDALAEKVLYTFAGGSGGGQPLANFISDKAGNLYGVTDDGGIICDVSQLGCGTVFELSPPAHKGGKWTKTTLHKFAGNGSDGSYPAPPRLIMDKDGNLYGTTTTGGEDNSGTIYRLTPPTKQNGKWKEKLLYSFKAGSDGLEPGGLVVGLDGSYYGVTTYGGDSEGDGTVFQFSKTASGGWKETVLYRFQNGTDGSAPSSFQTLAVDKKGNLFGTTLVGTAFEISPPAKKGGHWKESTLSGNIGFGIYAGLILDKTGNLYGANLNGGQDGAGFVFELSPGKGGTWTTATLYTFTGQSDGRYPYDSLIFDAKGNLYGTTYSFGPGDGGGVVFKMTPPQNGGDWTETVLYSFKGGSDGASPSGSLLEKSGMLYGTTQYGGTANKGTVFALRP
jgi:uncharacterized repeat protein (TIGR03803 family)